MATTLRDIGFRLGYQLDKQSEAKVENSIKSLKSTATKLLGAIGIGFSLKEFVNITEEFNGINDKINYAVKGLADQKEAQQAILKAANDTKTSYAGMADTVSQLVQVNKDLFPLDEAVQFATVTQKLLVTAGKSESEATALQGTIAKVFQTGQVSSAVLKNLYNQAPEVINTIADGMGVTSDKLYDLAEQGVLTGATLKSAILGATDEIEAGFDNLDYSISDAILNVRNTWGYFLDDLNSTLGITQTIAKGIVKMSNTIMGYAQKIKTRIEWLADKLGGTDKLLKLLAITVGAVFLALNADKIMSFLKGVGSALGGIKLKTLAIVAVFIILALLVEDFINFMQGNDSLIGTMLEKAGVDTDELREHVRELWAKVEQIVPTIRRFARTVGQQLVEAFTQLLPYLIEFGQQILPVLISLLGTVLDVVMQLGQDVLTFLLDLIMQLVPFLLQIVQAVLPVIIQLIQELLPFVLQIIEEVLPIIIELISALLPIILQIIETVLPVIIQLIETLLPLIMEIIEAVLPIVLELIQAILPLLVEIIDAVLPVIISLIEALLPVFKPIFDLVSNLVSAILPAVIKLLDAIKPILEPIASVLGVIGDVLGTIIGAIAKVVGWIASGLGWVIDLIFGTGGSDAGSNAAKVNGYAKGTDSSSDTFIAGEEGPELVTGQKGKKVFTALETGKIFEAMAMLGKAATVQPSTVTNSNSTRTVNQYNEFVNTFNGDKAGQQKSAAAMGAASDDAVSVMARALAFAR